MGLARHSYHSGSGKAPGQYQLAAQGGHTQRPCTPGSCLCRSPPGQSGIPKLMLRTPEPLGSRSEAASSLLGRPVLFPPPRLPLLLQAPHSIYSWTPSSHLPSFPWLLLAPPRGTYSCKKCIRPHCQSHTGLLHRLLELGSCQGPESAPQLPVTDKAPGHSIQGLAQGYSAGGPQSWDANPGLSRTLNNSDDAQMSMRGCLSGQEGRVRTSGHCLAPGSVSLPRQSGTRGKGTRELSAGTSDSLSAMFAHHQL